MGKEHNQTLCMHFYKNLCYPSIVIFRKKLFLFEFLDAPKAVLAYHVE